MLLGHLDCQRNDDYPLFNHGTLQRFAFLRHNVGQHGTRQTARNLKLFVLTVTKPATKFLISNMKRYLKLLIWLSNRQMTHKKTITIRLPKGSI